MKKFLSIFVFLTTLPLSAQAFLFGGFGGGTSSELIEEDEQAAAIPYPDYAAKHKVKGVKISPDGKWFATVAEEKVEGKDIATLRIWNSETKKRLAAHRPAPMSGIDGIGVAGIEFLPDGTGYILVKPRPQSADEAKGYRFNEAVVWNMDRTIRRRLSWGGDYNWGCGIAIHPDNQQAAICVQKLPVTDNGMFDGDFIFPRMEKGLLRPHVNSRILLLNIKDGEQIKLSDQLTLPKSIPEELLGYSPDGQLLAFRRFGHHEKEGALDDHTVVLLDSSSLTTSYTSEPRYRQLALSPDSSLVYSSINTRCNKEAEGQYECNPELAATPLQNGKLVDKQASAIKKLSYQWDSYWDDYNVLAAGPHGLVFAGGALLLHVTEPGNKGFFRELFKTSLKSKGRRLLAAKFLPDGSAIRFVTSDDTGSILLKSTAELQQLAERFRIERKACAAFAEAVKLAKVGIWGAMAEKFREGISTAPGMRGSDDSCWPRFQATDIVFNQDVRKHHPRLAQFGALQLELIASNEKSGGDVNARCEAWGEYAVMASLAGHPALVAAGVEEMKKLLAAEGGALNKDKAEKAVRALEGLALAGMGREDEAFTLLAKDKALKQYAWDVRNRPDAFWPLLGDRARVAYLLDVDESEVPKRSAVRPPAQPFPDPTGRIINPPGMAADAVAPAPTFSGGVSGGSSAPSPSPASGATILE